MKRKKHKCGRALNLMGFDAVGRDQNWKAGGSCGVSNGRKNAAAAERRTGEEAFVFLLDFALPCRHCCRRGLNNFCP